MTKFLPGDLVVVNSLHTGTIVHDSIPNPRTTLISIPDTRLRVYENELALVLQPELDSYVLTLLSYTGVVGFINESWLKKLP